ncbi:MAG: uridine kinase [Bacteroidota bacterium]
MINDVVTIEKKHTAAALTVHERVIRERKPKFIVTISGEVGTGKCEIAHELGRQFIEEGISVKLLHMDNYYHIPPRERLEWRKRVGLGKIGYEEYDWKSINENIEDFRLGRKSVLPLVDLFTQNVDKLHTDFKGIEMLIIEGLYSIQINQSDLRVFIELTYEDTWEEQSSTHKEVLDDFRREVLEYEHKAVQSLKSQADFYIDFDTAGERFHL